MGQPSPAAAGLLPGAFGLPADAQIDKLPQTRIDDGAGQQSPAVVITGMGWAAPPGIDPDATLEACRAGRTAIRRLEGLEGLSGVDCVMGATAPPFEVINRMRYPKSAKFMNRAVECAVLAAFNAAADSGLDWRSLNGERIALYTASGQTGLEYHTFFPALAAAWEGDRPRDYRFLGRREAHLIDRYFSLRTLANGGLAILSMELGARGSAGNHVHSDTGFALALRSAIADLREDRCDAAMVGGYDCLLTASTYLGYREAGLLSHDGAALRPFDRHGSGIVLGEGAGFFVLERGADARLRRAGIAELAGIGAVQDYSPSIASRWHRDELRTVIDDSGIPIGECDCVVAHGVGIPEADAEESAAWAKTLPDGIPMTAFKGLTGYCGAAAAAVELALTILCLRSGFVPPVAGFDEVPHSGFPDIVRREPRQVRSRRPSAILVSRSWGGSLAAIGVRVEQGRRQA